VIDTNGVIFWTPAAGQVPSTNLFTTRVTDSNPWATNEQQLSATNSFTVLVAPRPAISSFSVSDGAVTLVWDAVSGRTYRLQYADSLTETNWSHVLPDITATTSTATATLGVGTGSQRFYRVVVLP
jgi:hypothetical protein